MEKLDGILDFVNVSIRIKPCIEKEKHFIKVISKEPPILISVDRNQTFAFDNIFTDEISQETIYNESVKPLVEYVKKGYNCTVFAYGQTGTGKTYTMGTDPNVTKEEELGLIPRTLSQFLTCNTDDQSETDISVSFLEIYNEKVFDLLNNQEKSLPVKELKLHGFCQQKVRNVLEAKQLLKTGNKHRHTSGTKQNSKSSRSHAIFSIYCNIKNKDTETSAKLNLVDLAGCESVKKTGAHGSTFQEGVNINRGLLCIGQVMTALSTNSAFIPYRQSIITTVLQDSLNKQNFVSLIACVSPLVEDTSETLQTIEFAQRVKKLKNKPEVNEVVTQYKKDNPSIFQTPFKRSMQVSNKSLAMSSKKITLTEDSSVSSKKIKLLTTIDENNLNNNVELANNVESPVPIVHPSVSAMKTPVPTNFSPVFKKYFQKMEVSLMDKMEIMIKSTIKRPHMQNNDVDGLVDINGTPRVALNTLRKQISNIVRSEIAHCTPLMPARATSSPVALFNNPIRQTLNFDETAFTDLSHNSNDKENDFKVPQIPVKGTKKQRHSIALSPIQNISIRRSNRQRKNKKYTENIFMLNQSNFCRIKEKSEDEKSVILPSMQNSMNSQLTRNINSETKVNSYFEQSFQSCLFIDEKIRNDKHTSDASNYSRRRFSIRINQKSMLKRTEDEDEGLGTEVHKKQTLNVCDTTAGKRLMKGHHRKNSPCTLHTQSVLQLLNTGSVKQLGKLQTIGPKTAQQIYLFRQIHGKFEKISDLKAMWPSGIKYEKFVDANFLKKELVN